jgi:hypothetical protein
MTDVTGVFSLLMHLKALSTERQDLSATFQFWGDNIELP